MLSPKQAPPAIAQTVRIGLPSTMWDSHMKIGAQAAKVPQEVPVATDRQQQQMKPTAATDFAVIPRDSAILMIAAPTP